MSRTRLILISAALLISGSAVADSMRCGKYIVNESATVDELLKKCGEPQSRDVSKEEQFAVNPSGARYKTGGFTIRERWIYKPSPGTLAMAVSIVDGKVTSLARAD
jgi:hypothetical protein